MKIEELNSISYQFYLNQGFKKNELKFDTFYANDVVASLKNSVLSNKLIYEIFLYTQGSKYLYSSQGASTVEHFIKNVYNFESWTTETFTKELENIRNNTQKSLQNVICNNVNERIVTFIFPEVSMNYGTKRTMLFLVKEKALHDF